MQENVTSATLTSHREAAQSLGLMTTALLLSGLVGLSGSQVVLSIVAFCIFFMIVVAGSLFLIEGRMVPDKPTPVLSFCLPAIGVLGFTVALLAAAGAWALAMLVVAVAFAFAAYRRRTLQGEFNLIPLAGLDLGVVGGVGASIGGIFLIALGALVA